MSNHNRSVIMNRHQSSKLLMDTSMQSAKGGNDRSFEQGNQPKTPRSLSRSITGLFKCKEEKKERSASYARGK